MKRTMLMAAAIWGLGSMSAYANQDGNGEAIEEPAPAPDTWTPGTHPTPTAPVPTPTAPVVPEPTPVVPEAMAPVPIQPVPVAVPVPVQPKVYRVGASVLLGGGFQDFTNNTLQDMTSGAGTWNARLVAGTRQYVGLEAAYVGSAQGINTLGIASDANLVGNGIEGAFRVNVPVARGLSLIEPFGFVGVGWSHYNLTNAGINTSDIGDNDDILTLPYGGGLAFAYGMFMADARFTYRQTYLNDMLQTTGGNLNNWGLSGQVGVEF